MKQNRIIVVLMIMIVLFIVLASCNSAEPADTNTFRQSPTFPPTWTSAQANTALPTSTPTQQPTSTPSVEYLPGTENSLFPIPNIRSSWFPPPIPTPELPATSYQLKTWSEEDALQLIHTMDQFAYESDLSLAGISSYYSAYQTQVKLGVQEAMLRYPDSAYTTDYEWKLAVSNLYLTDTSTDNWILEQIEQALNANEVTPENLNDLLYPRGMQTGEIIPLENIFGDQRTAYMFWVRTRKNSPANDLLIMMTENEGIYDLFFPTEDFFYSYSQKSKDPHYTLIDHNKNGIPELIFSRGVCYNRIFEWRDNEFIDLGKNIYGCSYSGSPFISYSPEDYPGYDLVANNYGDIYKYVWNGKKYQLMEVEYSDPGDLVQMAFDDNDLPSAIENAEHILTNWATQNTLNMQIRDKDEWESLLGFLYILQDSPDGISMLQQVSTSYNTENANIAEEFLDIYAGSQSNLLEACLHIQNNYYTNRIFCDIGTSFTKLFENASPAELPALLEKVKNLDSVQHTTLSPENLDTPIHVVTFYETQKSDDYPESYDTYVYLVYDLNYRIEVYQLGFNFTYTQPGELSVSQAQLPGMDVPAFLIKSGKDTFLVEISQENNTLLINEIYSIYGAGGYTVVSSNEHYYIYGVETFLYEYTNYCEQNSFIFPVESIWDTQRLEATDVDLLDSLIFKEQDFKQAINVAQDLLKTIEPYYTEAQLREEECEYIDDEVIGYEIRFLYLLGLAYELNGDTELAAQTYYKLWQEVPDSGYALMARAKLVEKP